MSNRTVVLGRHRSFNGCNSCVDDYVETKPNAERYFAWESSGCRLVSCDCLLELAVSCCLNALVVWNVSVVTGVGISVFGVTHKASTFSSSHGSRVHLWSVDVVIVMSAIFVCGTVD
jgi:hypothetical protein